MIEQKIEVPDPVELMAIWLKAIRKLPFVRFIPGGEDAEFFCLLAVTPKGIEQVLTPTGKRETHCLECHFMASGVVEFELDEKKHFELKHEQDCLTQLEEKFSALGIEKREVKKAHKDNDYKLSIYIIPGWQAAYDFMCDWIRYLKEKYYPADTPKEQTFEGQSPIHFESEILLVSASLGFSKGFFYIVIINNLFIYPPTETHMYQDLQEEKTPLSEKNTNGEITTEHEKKKEEINNILGKDASPALSGYYIDFQNKLNSMSELPQDIQSALKTIFLKTVGTAFDYFNTMNPEFILALRTHSMFDDPETDPRSPFIFSTVRGVNGGHTTFQIFLHDSETPNPKINYCIIFTKDKTTNGGDKDSLQTDSFEEFIDYINKHK